jgi:hypothetical protein
VKNVEIETAGIGGRRVFQAIVFMPRGNCNMVEEGFRVYILI